MLRESSKVKGTKLHLRDITAGLTDKTDLQHGDILVELAEAIVSRDTEAIELARAKVYEALGNDATVDAVAVASAFHGFVRIADAIGIPYTTAAQGKGNDIHEEVGINDFYRIKGY